jgi:hypothetical protein
VKMKKHCVVYSLIKTIRSVFMRKGINNYNKNRIRIEYMALNSGSTDYDLTG